MSQLVKTMLRVALGALAVLMVPLVASHVVEGWNWNAGSFVVVYVLFFGTGMVYAVIARKMGAWSYKAGVGVALVAGFALGMTVSRFVADGLSARFGPVRLVRAGGSAAAVGLVLGLLSSHWAPTIAAYTVVGAALAPVVPTVFSAAGNLPSGARALTRSLAPTWRTA